MNEAGSEKRRAGFRHVRPLELVAAYTPLDDEEIERDAGEDDEEHDRCDRCAHRPVAHLVLEAEEGAVEQRAENVRRAIRSGERALPREDQVEGGEITEQGEYREDADRRREQRMFREEEQKGK